MKYLLDYIRVKKALKDYLSSFGTIFRKGRKNT